MIVSRKISIQAATALLAAFALVCGLGAATDSVAAAADPSYAWAINGGGTDADVAFGVSALPDGSSIITGSFSGSATFGATTLTSTGLFDTLTAKAHAAGSESDYIVLYKSGANLTQKVQSEEARGNDVQDVFRSAVKGFVAPLDAADVRRLRARSDVLLVEKDKPVRALSAGPRSGLAASWGLDRIDQRTLPLNSQISTSQNGFGVTAYIIDTGIRLDHSEFGGRATVGFNATGDGKGTYDCNGHGTHVAGTVGGATYGVAPEVSLVAVRVLNCSGSGSTSGVIGGIDWATANHVAGVPAVANMSLGGGYSPALNTATQNAITDGISFAVAAGNSAEDACYSSPASTPNAITVAATSSNDARASYSNYGSCVDIFAPGSSIKSSWNTSATATKIISGTSMASPHVAGAAALILSASPSSTPAQVATAMTAASTAGVVTDRGRSSVNRLLFAGAASTAPANDNFANAVTLSSLAPVTGTTVTATHESGEPDHASWIGVAGSAGAAASIWYSWTAPDDGTLALNTRGSSYPTLLAVYSGSAVSDLTLRAFDRGVFSHGGSRFWSRVSFSVTAGTVYRIAVDGFDGAVGATNLAGTFTASTPTPTPTPTPAPTLPANDNFANAVTLSSLAPVTGTTVAATRESEEPYHYAAGSWHSIWYNWTAPDDGTLTLSTEGSDIDTVLAVYTGSAVSSRYLERRAVSWDAGGFSWSQVSFRVTAGTVYRIAVDGQGQETGATRLAGTFTTAPANDNFANAVTLSSLAAVTGTTFAATHESGEPDPSGESAEASIWYNWRAPDDGTLTLSTEGSDFDTVLAVYTGSAVSGLTRRAANWSQVSFSVTAGTVYRIAVDGHFARDGYRRSTGATRLAGTFTTTPANDNFANAVTLSSLAAVTGTTVAATHESGEPKHVSPNWRPEGSIWYNWTASADGGLTLSTEGSDFDTLLAVYTGSAVSGLTQVVANDDASDDRRWSQVSFRVTAGTVYRIAVDGYGGETGATKLAGSTFTPVPIPPANDPDRDDDGIPDMRDNCDPYAPDSGKGDRLTLSLVGVGRLSTYNPNQQDTDKDGIGDACDKTPGTYDGGGSGPAVKRKATRIKLTGAPVGGISVKQRKRILARADASSERFIEGLISPNDERSVKEQIVTAVITLQKGRNLKWKTLKLKDQATWSEGYFNFRITKKVLRGAEIRSIVLTTVAGTSYKAGRVSFRWKNGW